MCDSVTCHVTFYNIMLNPNPESTNERNGKENNEK